MWYHSAAFLTTFVAAATPDPSSTGSQSVTDFTGDPRGIIVTAITTAGVILVALISTRHSNRTGKNDTPGPPPPAQSDDDIGDMAVLEYRVGQLEKDEAVQNQRLDSLERGRGSGAHRDAQ